MVFGFDGIIYLVGSIILIGMYFTRKKSLSSFRPENLSELDWAARSELKRLLESAYERLLFLGLGLLILASVCFSGLDAGLKAFFLFLVFVLFFANIPPRHKLMKILLVNGISLKRIREAGLKL